MSVVADIWLSYRKPDQVGRERLARTSEASALACLMGAVLLIFIAQWPRLGREAHFDPSVPFDARLGAALLGIVFILPLVAYVFSGVLWLVQRAFGFGLTGLQVRAALFWTFLAVTPLWLVHGFLSGFVSGSVVVDVVGFATLVAFVAILVAGMRAMRVSG